METAAKILIMILALALSIMVLSMATIAVSGVCQVLTGHGHDTMC